MNIEKIEQGMIVIPDIEGAFNMTFNRELFNESIKEMIYNFLVDIRDSEGSYTCMESLNNLIKRNDIIGSVLNQNHTILEDIKLLAKVENLSDDEIVSFIFNDNVNYNLNNLINVKGLLNVLDSYK